MRTTRASSASFAAVLSAAVLAASATAATSADRPGAAGSTTSGTSADTGTRAPRNPGPPTWPVNPQVIPRPHEVSADSGSGLDWDSAGIGAATVLGAFALGTTGVAVVRRRRISRLSLPSH